MASLPDPYARLREIAVILAQEHKEPVILVKVPPSKREYANMIPYVTLLSQATCDEKAFLERGSAAVERITPIN